ncbi:Bud site selection protein [Yarrowia sp. B02]|nr:Bud site selection protein [Yarrowia sp. B02]
MRWYSLLLLWTPAAASYAVHPVQLPKLNTDNFGEMGILGDYDGISRVEYGGQQNFSSFSAAQVAQIGHDSPHVIAQVNSSVLISLAQVELAHNQTIKQCQLNNDLYVTDGQGLWTVDIAEGTVNAISTGLNGTIFALYCDTTDNSVLVGGDMANGVAQWDTQKQDFAVPGFGGFKNGSVTGITRLGDNLVFTGSFQGIVHDKGTNHTVQHNVTDITDLDLTGLASNSSTLELLNGNHGSNSSETLQQIARRVNQTINAPQQISFQSAQIQAEGTAGDVDPKGISCPGSTAWALTPDRQGTWRANFPYSFTPSIVVIDNLPESSGGGTEMLRFLAFPLNGIMNLSYVENGDRKYCDAFCPMPQGGSREFTFVNSIGMNSFQLDLLSFYGDHAGLSGVEMFHAERFTFADNQLNEGNGCSRNMTQATNATAQGDFTTQGTYLSSSIDSQQALDSTQVSFSPNASYSGNYTVRLFTPGCIQDNSCAARGGVDVTVQTSPSDSHSMTLFQTNNQDKYDTIFSGPINVTSGFHPSVTLKPSPQGPIPRNFVADRLQFTMTSVSNLTQIFGDSYLNFTLLGGKNGSRLVNTSEIVDIRNIFEYSPGNFSTSNQTVGNTTLNRLGPLINGRLTFIETSESDDGVVLAGEFISPIGKNLLQVSNTSSLFSNSTSANKTDIDGPITILTSIEGTIVVGTSDGLFHLDGDAIHKIDGIPGSVDALVQYTFNDTKHVWAATGNYSEPSVFFNSTTWEKTELPVSAYLRAGGSGDAVTVYLGMLSMSQVEAQGAVYLESELNLVPVEKPSNSSLTKRQNTNQTDSNQTVSYYTGHYVNESTLVLGGSDLTILQDGVSVGPSNSLGYPANITSLASSNNSNMLFIGGAFSSDVGDSQVTNLAFFDLNSNDFASLQPPGLTGGNVTRLEYRASSSTLVAAGSFNMAGSLMCSAFCLYDMDAARWNSPASSISGVVNYLEFLSNDILLMGGNMTFDDQTASVAQYDFSTGGFSSIMNGNQTDFEAVQIVMTNNDLTNVYVVGKGSSGQKLVHWNGTVWDEVSIPGLEDTSYITSLQLLQTGGKKKRDNAVTLESDQLLMISGDIQTNQGNFSSVLFDGQSVQPFLVTQSKSGQGSINGFFSQSSTSYSPIHKKKKMRRGFVVLVALAVAVGVMFLIVGIGIIATCLRRRNSGYMLAPGRVNEAEMTQTVPPQNLFEDLHGYNNNQKF